MPSPDKARVPNHSLISEVYGVTQADKDAAFESLIKTKVNATTAPDNLRASYDELITEMESRYTPEQLEEATRLANEQINQGKLD